MTDFEKRKALKLSGLNCRLKDVLSKLDCFVISDQFSAIQYAQLISLKAQLMQEINTINSASPDCVLKDDEYLIGLRVKTNDTR